MIRYTCFRFSEVMNQMFLTVRGAVQGSFRATHGVASVFVHVVLLPGWRARRCPPSTTNNNTSVFSSSMLIKII